MPEEVGRFNASRCTFGLSCLLDGCSILHQQPPPPPLPSFPPSLPHLHLFVFIPPCRLIYGKMRRSYQAVTPPLIFTTRPPRSYYSCTNRLRLLRLSYAGYEPDPARISIWDMVFACTHAETKDYPHPSVHDKYLCPCCCIST